MARPVIAALSAISLGACASLPFGGEVDTYTSRELADMVFICVTPPTYHATVRDLSTNHVNGLLPLQSRIGACQGSPQHAHDVFTAFNTNIYAREPQSAVLPLPVDQQGYFIVALADGDDKLAGYQIVANDDAYHCTATYQTAPDGTLSARHISAHMMGEANPVIFDTLETMAAINSRNRAFGCVSALQTGASVLQRPDFAASMGRVFAVRMARGPRHEA